MVATVVSNYKSQLSQKLPAIIWTTATHQRFSHNKFLGADIFKSKSENQPCLSQSYILQPVKDLSEQNSSKFHKKWRGGQSLSVLLFYLNRNCVYLKITTSGRHVFRRMFFLDPIFCSTDWNDTQNQFEMKIYLAW